jgi:hypothetical protein
MAVTLSTAMRNALGTAFITAIDAGAGPGKISFYTATRPTSPDDAVTSQTLLGTVTFSDPCGTVSGGVLTFDTITDDSSADADGTTTWARLYDSADTAIMDMSVTATGGGGDIELNTTSIVTGGPISITSATLTMAG